MELQDFEALKVIPGYTSILKAVLKSQIQLLVRPNLKIKVKILNFWTLEIFAVIILNSNNVAKPKGFFLRKNMQMEQQTVPSGLTVEILEQSDLGLHCFT